MILYFLRFIAAGLRTLWLIISAFIGEQLEDVVNQLISTGNATKSKRGEVLQTGVNSLPDFMKDATDRNRTSPFAFTGNKFEFRMVGSRDTIAGANIVLNTIVADSFCEACDRLENAADFDTAVHELIKEFLTDHKRIIFNGNGYSREWVEEAARRGLPNIPSMVEAIPTLTSEPSVAVFEKFGVYTRTELESRVEIKYETYCKTINVEARTMIDMAGKQFVPSFISYAKALSDAVCSVKEAGQDPEVQGRLLRQTLILLRETDEALEVLRKVTDEAAALPEGADKARFYRVFVVPAMDNLRSPVDKMEMIMDKELWPMPSYGDLLFGV